MMCLVCNKDISKNHFSQHLERYHSLSKGEYRDKFSLNNFCSCGCGTKIKDKLKWAWGHHSRVNNISKRSDVREKRRQKMQEWHDSGEWQPWNRGLTVRDERVKKNVKALNSIWKNSSVRDNQSKRMSKLWQEGKIVPLKAEKSSNWKGGVSSVHALIKADGCLYSQWKFPILKRDEFKCVKCGFSKQLEVHHNKEQMSEIVKKFVSKKDKEKTFEEKKDVCKRIVKYHIDNNVSGITLCKKCHKELHKSYNF